MLFSSYPLVHVDGLFYCRESCGETNRRNVFDLFSNNLVVLGFSHTKRGSYVHVPFNDIVYPIFTHSRRSKICFSVGLFFSVMKRKVKRDN